MAGPDALIAATGLRHRYAMRFCRRNANGATTSPHHFHSLWQGSGYGGATSTNPTLGRANGRTCSKATNGALLFPNAPLGKSWFIQAPNITVVDHPGHYILMDRLADVLVNVSDNGAITGCDGTARLATGEGGMIFIEVVTALSAATNTFTLTYDDDADVSRTTPTITTVASTAQSKQVNSIYVYMPLNTASKGCRRITAINALSGAATGTILISIVKPLFEFSAATRGIYERDLFTEFPGGVKVDNNACLFFGGLGASSGVLPKVYGSLGLVALT